MYVIFPADELILMTYGGPALPRIKPRPTLDCLRDPQVPFDLQRSTTANTTAAPTTIQKPDTASVNYPALPAEEFSVAPLPNHTTAYNYTNYNGYNAALPPLPPKPSSSTAASPTPSRRLSRSSLTRPEPGQATVTRSSLRSSTRSRQATPPLPPPPQQQQQPLLQQLPAKTATPPIPPMYNDPNMRATPKQPQQQQRAPTQRPPLEHCKSIQSSAPPKGILYDPAYYPGDERGAHHSGGNPSTPAYPSSTLANHPHRDRSPSIFLEPPSDVPTQPTWFGPGWGRPMSPMELPPEPPHSSHSLSGGGGAGGGGSSVGSKSPTSKSRLRPKLHIPLGRLGRSSSSDQRESHRLRDDTQLHVENPIFNRANLSAQNFDAFFESGEPVYKLQPKTPGTLSPDGSQGYSPEQLSSAAGVYESTASRNRGSGGGGLFARSPRDEKALSARSKSTEHYEPQQREERAPSVSKGGGGSGGSSGGGGGGGVPQKDFSGKSSSGRKSRSFFGWRGPRGGSLGPKPSMASYNGVLKDYGHSSLNEAFKSQNNVNFKLIKTVSDFTETLSQLYEEHATALQTLVSNYRKKNGELRKERPACHLTIFQAWETFLQEVETDSQASNDVASVLSRQVSRPMLDKSFHRKVQSRKIFTHRESFETIIAKTEEKLSKCRLDYKQCYVSHRQNPTQLSLTEYIDAHNAYVQQLHATNAMLEIYHCETVPQLMQELEEIHNDLCSIIADSILQGADVIATKATDQAKRYSNLTSQCGSITPTQDLTNFVRILPLPSQAQKVPRRIFAPPQPAAGQLAGGDTDDGGDYNEMTPLLRNELIFDRHSTLSLRPALESLKREAIDLEIQIRQLQDSIDVLNRTQSRGIEGQLYNKVNELQEDLSMKKFDLRAKQIHLAAIRSQKELFVSKVDPGSPRAERKLSAASAPSMKTKWLKAFRSLKPASGSAAPSDRRNGAAGTSSQPLRPNEDGSHHLQEYTYKKITACDVCSQILRGHTRQGLRCRICKLNAHGDCASQLPRCQPKQKLLRRQKSTSELENRVDVEEERPYEDGGGGGFEPVVSDENHETLLNVPSRKFRQKTPFIDRIAQLEFTDLDQIYRVLKQAGELKSAHLTAAVAADKSVHIEGAGGAGHVSSITTIVTQPDIPIVNVPECPERQGATAIGASSMTTGGGGGSVVGGLGVGGGFAAAAGRVARGIRPPPVSMPILGVQLQQQELQQQRGALPVPAPDISSSSDYRLPGNVSQIASVAGMSTSAYISGGIGINYYTATGAGGVGNVVVSSTTAQQQQQQTLQQQQQQFVPDTGLRRRLFAGFRPLSGFGRLRSRSSQHRSISLPETPHSPRRQKLNLRMKSLSLDSPESSELHGQIRRRQQPGAPGAGPSTGGAGGVYYHGGSGGHLEHSTPPSNNSRLHSPSSPSHQGRKLLYASRGMRGGSVDLPDEMEKSQSSASTSPCPSPVRIFQKSHRLLPTNLYVILYNFKARHADELDLKAGYKVTVIDTSDPDWWKGKVLGRVGYFPSKYCVRLNANEKPLQVTHNLQVSDGERGENMTLLRDQIVIQTGDEVNGMVTVRSADNRQGYCPIKYLQEV